MTDTFRGELAREGDWSWRCTCGVLYGFGIWFGNRAEFTVTWWLAALIGVGLVFGTLAADRIEDAVKAAYHRRKARVA